MRILWDEEEALLLFDAFDLMLRFPDKKKEIKAMQE